MMSITAPCQSVRRMRRLCERHQPLTVRLREHEPDTTHGVNQLDWLLVIDLAAQPRNVHVDDVVEWRGARRLLPDVARQRFTRDDLTLVAHQVLEQFELAYRQVDGSARPVSPCG